ncbi:TonB-dependent receptor [Sphingobium sp. SYK-6]|uniref:TonB-dependent receptor n=1 Tax=Sphingobium sp. (strain NBRC 103272 / SYK-6) TaxID=627192 RepID=UPI0002FE51B4|nr:TonB-dependent receptor [Sphingobium sp. SYK-6]
MLAISTVIAAPAWAQGESTPQDNPGADPTDIIVTAQFRETRLQDTPIAITAVNAAMLEQRAQTNVSDIAAQAPNVTLQPQGQFNGSGLVAFIRGVGQVDFNYALEPGVGIYVDDVYYPTVTGSLLDLMDLDRIEVLRGPQGTLAGKNSIGGAIKLFSTKPDGSGRGSFQVTYGSFDRVEARGFADFAITDKLFARIAGSAQSRDGYVTRLDYGLTHPGSGVPSNNNTGKGVELGTLGGKSYVAGRLSLRWLPSETVEINIAGDYTRDNSEAGASVLLHAASDANGQNPWIDPITGLQVTNRTGTNADGQPWVANTITGAPILYDCKFVPYGRYSCDTPPAGYDRRFISYETFQDQMAPTSQSPYKPYAVNPIQHFNGWGVQGTIDIELAPTLKLTSITAYRRYDSSWAQGEDGSPLPSQQLLQTLEHRMWSEEIRLNGSLGEGLFEYTLGGFYHDQDGSLNARVDLNYAGIDFIHGPDSTPSTSKALYFNGTFHATDALNISGGIRHSWDEKTYTYFRSNPDGTIPGPLPCAFFLGAPTAGPTGIGNDPNCLLLGLYDVSDTFKGERTDWRVAADYRFSEAAMVYAQVTTGYKGGGVNPRPFFGPSSPNNQLKAFNPETLTTYEVGFKTDLFDRKLRLNGALFFNKYNDIILTLSACPISPCLQPNNVGKADVKGVELEFTARPFDHFTIDGSFSYLDFEYTELNGTEAELGGLTLDMITPYTPKWKWSGGIQYDFPLGSDTLTARLDGDYQSHMYAEAINDPRYNKIDGRFLMNARLAYRTADNDWTFALEVRNLTDKYYYTSLFDQHFSSSTVSAGVGLPRTWAATIKRNF